MKKVIALVMSIVLLCCLFAGCGQEQPVETSGKKPAMTQPTPRPTERPRETIEPYSPYLELGQMGKQRIPYTINLSNVRYVTSVEMLPDHECFARYNEEYFKDRALLIVTETVNSGSVEVQIESVMIDGNTATVTLAHSGAGGIGTGDMAVWLIWAEVELGLVYNWTVANPAIESGASQT